uniref:hypothetical protein n=1 Tax=Pleomorphochaeta sp. DL1XJH-081 TaxID=3409690 RepID=UPI003BB62648
SHYLIVSVAAGAVGASAASAALAVSIVLGRGRGIHHHAVGVALLGLNDVGCVALLPALGFVSAVAVSAVDRRHDDVYGG